MAQAPAGAPVSRHSAGFAHTRLKNQHSGDYTASHVEAVTEPQNATIKIIYGAS